MIPKKDDKKPKDSKPGTRPDSDNKKYEGVPDDDDARLEWRESERFPRKPPGKDDPFSK